MYKWLLLIGPMFSYLHSAAQHSNGSFFDNLLVQERLIEGLVFDIIQDRQGFMWFGTEFGLIQYDGRRIKTFHHHPQDPVSISDNVVTCLAEDSLGNLWVGTMYGGLNYFDRRQNKFTRFIKIAGDSCSLSAPRINDVVINSKHQVIITIEGAGIHLLEPGDHCFKKIHYPELPSNYVDNLWLDQDNHILCGHFFGINSVNPSTLQTESFPLEVEGMNRLQVVKAMSRDINGNLWIGSRDMGLFYQPSGQSSLEPIKEFCASSNQRKKNIWSIYPVTADEILIATDEGLYALTRKNKSWDVSSFSLGAAERALVIQRSRDGVFWVGTNQGVLVMTPRYKKFNNLSVTRSPDKTGIKGVTCTGLAKDGQLWIGTVDGLFKFNPSTQIFDQNYLVQHPQLAFLKSASITFVSEMADGQLWIGTISGFNSQFRVFNFRPAQALVTEFTHRCEPFKRHVTFQMTEDHQRNLWFANGTGLVKYNPFNDSLKTYRHDPADTGSVASNFINRVFRSKNDELWIGTNDAGLDRYDFRQEVFKHHQAKIGSPHHLSHPRVLHLAEDAGGNLLIGTAGGLNILHAQDSRIDQWLSGSGLPGEIVNGVTADAQDNLWVTTPKSMALFDRVTRQFTVFDRHDGLELNEFWDRTALRTPDGQMYFGTDLGLLNFDPTQILVNSFSGQIKFTDFALFNKVIENYDQSILKANINFDAEVTLTQRQNVFTIYFSYLSYIRPDKNSYLIKLEGFEDEWQPINHKTEATYTNLDPGKYIFRVKGYNNDGVGSEQVAKLFLTVLTPWWKSNLALFVYLLLTSLVIWSIYRLQLARHLQSVENKRLVELDNFKSKFYTNITHEFRTPLTLILGPVENALKQKLLLNFNEINLIKRNADRLLNLINHILELSKLEAHKSSIHLVHGDLIPFLNYVVESFYLKAKEKNIRLDLFTAIDTLWTDFDPDKLSVILSNLISNALKFTPENGKVNIVIRHPVDKEKMDFFLITVQDTGTGIPVDQMKNIFNRFYVGHKNNVEGTGIGLALVKELTELLGGKVGVESSEGQGSIFTIELPYLRHEGTPIFNVDKAKNHLNQENSLAATKIIDKELPLVLIVDDNQEVAHFIGDSVKHGYQPCYAYHGQSGLVKAIEIVPDIIISDIMMEDMDGLDMLERLKKDERTSHIPIILLTAKADAESRHLGLSKMADAYLVKPIHREELLLVLGNLTNLIKKTQRYYARTKFLYQEPAGDKKTEESFLTKIRTFCEAHLSDDHFTVEELCKELNISHSQLHRKMIALTGESVHNFVLQVRLSKAKDKLVHSSLNITQIAYECGFNDPAYFTRVFSKEFGHSPSEWRKKL